LSDGIFARRSDHGLLVLARVLVGAVVVFVVTFLFFTITAFAATVPCNWAVFLDIVERSQCAKSVSVVDLRRTVDFSNLRCEDREKSDVVTIEDELDLTGDLDKIVRTAMIERKMSVDLDVRSNSGSWSKHGQTDADAGGGNIFRTYVFPRSLFFSGDRRHGKLQLRWTWRHAYQSDHEGIAITGSDDYELRNLTVKYKFPPKVGISDRSFNFFPAVANCRTELDGFVCENLNTHQEVRETWTWDVWTRCQTRSDAH
jgi:hypothetical protein